MEAVLTALDNTSIVKVGPGRGSLQLGAFGLDELMVAEGELTVVDAESTTAAQACALTIAPAAKLIVDKMELSAKTLQGEGLVEEVNGGRLCYAFGASGSDDTVLYDAIGESWPTLVKTGTNRAIVQLETPMTSDLVVREGTVVFSGRQCTNEWYRWVLKGTYYGGSKQLALGDLCLYPDIEKSECLAKGLVPGTDALTLERGQAVASFATTTTKPSGWESCNLWDVRNLFDDSVYNAVVSRDNLNLAQQNEMVTFRLAEGQNRVGAYLPVNSYLTWHAHPSDWEFQTSVDGLHWTTLDVRSGQRNEASGGNNGGVPFVLKGFLADGAAGLSERATVMVAAGATVDFGAVEGGQVLSKIEVDFSAGGGRIANFRTGAGGTLHLRNVPAGETLSTVAIPLTLEGVSDARNFTTWTIVANGVPVPGRRLVFREGRLMAVPFGLSLIIR